MLSNIDISREIINLLLNNGVEYKEIKKVLEQSLNEIDHLLWHKISVSTVINNYLKDIAWYNLEHIPNEGEIKGKSNLRFMGSKYPILASINIVDNYVNYEDAIKLLNELEDIQSHWDNNWIFVSLYTKIDKEWKYGNDNPDDILIHHENENIFLNADSKMMNINGKNVSKNSVNIMCTVSDKIGEYGRGPLIKQLLNQLINSLKLAIENKKGIEIMFH